MTISDTQWEDVLWDREDGGMYTDGAAALHEENTDDLYVYGDDDIPQKRPGDWVGVDRDRRSAYLIMGALRSEGIL